MQIVNHSNYFQIKCIFKIPKHAFITPNTSVITNYHDLYKKKLVCSEKN